MNQQEARLFALSLLSGEISDTFLAFDAGYRDGHYSDADVVRIERAFENILDQIDLKIRRSEATLAKKKGEEK